MERDRSAQGSAQPQPERGPRPRAPGKQTLVDLASTPGQARPAPGPGRATDRAAEPATVASLFGPRARPAESGGQPMPADVQAKMERAFGADFSRVRIHEGAHAGAMGALAYTQGTDIHFAPGQYDPTSPRGQELLGHELAHVVQQAQGRVSATPQASGAAWSGDAGLEHEADALGARAARGERANAGAVIAPAHAANAPMQARLPDPGYEYAVRTAEPQHEHSNLQGIQNLLVRIYTHDLSPEDQKLLENQCGSSAVNLPQALYAPPSEHTRHAYNWACKLFPGLIYPGHEAPREPTDLHEHANRERIVEGVRAVLAWMCGSGSDTELASVFGHDHVAEAREHAGRVQAWVLGDGFASTIGIDRTGESDEMMIGGHASFHSHIRLRSDAFAQAPSPDLIASVTHEAFHAGDQLVLDNGGYPGAPVDFRQRSPSEKLVNASHYEEVARRYLGASPLGGDFVPALRVEQSEDGTTRQVDTRSPIEQATDRARHTVQIAWERCQNVHGFLKTHTHIKHTTGDTNDPTAAEVTPILRWSRILHLQIHDRFDEAHPQSVAVNHIDLLQVETLTKSLGRMMRLPLVELLGETPTGAQHALKLSDAAFADLITDCLLQALVRRQADARWLKPDDFKRMIVALSVAPQDVRGVA